MRCLMLDWINDEKISSFFLLHQLLGTFPYRVNRGKFTTHKILHFWNYFVIFSIIGTCFSFILYVPPFLQGTLILVFVNAVQMVIIITPVLLFFVSVVLNKSKLDKYLYYIRSTGNSSFGHSNTVTILILSLCQITLVFFIMTDYNIFIANMNIYVVDYSCFLMFISIGGQFSGILISINNRFIVLRKSLSSGNPIKLVDSLKTYEKLITICKEVNDVYGFPIIFVFAYSFAFSITECYSALSKTAPSALMYVIWSIIVWSSTFRLIFTCSQVMYQVFSCFLLFFF